MASISLVQASLAILSLICFFLFKKHHKGFLRNWPVLGMLPGLLMEFHRIYDFSVELLHKSNSTFTFKGPWFCGMDMVFTADDKNIRYIMNSGNYTKGSDFREVFDVLGDGILSADSELWKSLRKVSKAMVDHKGFQKLSMSTTRKKLKEGLVPLFNRIAKEGTDVDLQDVFGRFMFGITVRTVTGFVDPGSLSSGMPTKVDDFAKALNNIGEGTMYRHVKPKFLWKLQRWVGFGQEKKLSEADATLNRTFANFISAKREKIRSSCGEEGGEDLLTSHMKLHETMYLRPNDDKFLRDTMLSFILAGRDTTASALTWFFWHLSQNPHIVSNIRQEINTNLPSDPNEPSSSYAFMEFLNKLVYLRGALCESMRLHPPVPFERLSPIKSDVLPSGHKVDPNMKILIFTYALGRMKAVWGKDASEFKPERWISETGGMKHVSSSKFFAFNTGPRACLGKEVAITLMKTVVVEILQNFDIQVVDGQKIEPTPGPILRMKHGIRVKLTCLTKTCSSSN